MYSIVCALPSWFYSPINYTTIHYKYDHSIESYITLHGRNSWLQPWSFQNTELGNDVTCHIYANTYIAVYNRSGQKHCDLHLLEIRLPLILIYVNKMICALTPTRFVIEQGKSTFTEQGEQKFLIYGALLAPLCHLEWNLFKKLTLENR